MKYEKNANPKDYSLLRPATLEYVKAGGKICWHDGDAGVECFVTSDDKAILYIPRICNSELLDCRVKEYFEKYIRQAPLCFVEGKPVYKGDVLYGIGACSDLMYIVKEYIDGAIYTEENETNAYCEGIENLTWTKPVTKKKYWVNLYSTHVMKFWTLHPSREVADERAKCSNGTIDPERIACVEIELEE